MRKSSTHRRGKLAASMKWDMWKIADTLVSLGLLAATRY